MYDKHKGSNFAILHVIYRVKVNSEFTKIHIERENFKNMKQVPTYIICEMIWK